MPTQPQFNPRTMMEMAIEVMRQSVHEPRADQKASPLVGAVLRKADARIASLSIRTKIRTSCPDTTPFTHEFEFRQNPVKSVGIREALLTGILQIPSAPPLAP